MLSKNGSAGRSIEDENSAAKNQGQVAALIENNGRIPERLRIVSAQFVMNASEIDESTGSFSPSSIRYHGREQHPIELIWNRIVIRYPIRRDEEFDETSLLDGEDKINMGGIRGNGSNVVFVIVVGPSAATALQFFACWLEGHADEVNLIRFS